MAMLGNTLGKRGNHVVVYMLTQWYNAPKDEATWELYSGIEKRFPNFKFTI